MKTISISTQNDISKYCPNAGMLAHQVTLNKTVTFNDLLSYMNGIDNADNVYWLPIKFYKWYTNESELDIINEEFGIDEFRLGAPEIIEINLVNMFGVRPIPAWIFNNNLVIPTLKEQNATALRILITLVTSNMNVWGIGYWFTNIDNPNYIPPKPIELGKSYYNSQLVFEGLELAKNPVLNLTFYK